MSLKCCEFIRRTANVDLGAVQKRANHVELEKYRKLSLYLQNSASILPRTDPPKFGLPVYRHTCSGTARTGVSCTETMQQADRVIADPPKTSAAASAALCITSCHLHHLHFENAIYARTCTNLESYLRIDVYVVKS